MFKKLLFFLCVSLTAALSAQDKDFSINADLDYFNPFALSFKWSVVASRPLGAGENISLKLSIVDRMTNKEINSFEGSLADAKKRIRFYLFFQQDKDSSILDFCSPDDGFNKRLSRSAVSGKHRFVYMNSIDANSGEKVLLAKIEQCTGIDGNPPGYLIKETPGANVVPAAKDAAASNSAINYDIYITPVLNNKKKAELSEKASLEELRKRYEALGKDSLAKALKDAQEKRRLAEAQYAQGKTTLDALNKIQEEISIISALLSAASVQPSAAPASVPAGK